MKIIEQFKNWLIRKIRPCGCCATKTGADEEPTYVKAEFEDPRDCRIYYKKDRRGKWWWRMIQDGGKILAQSSRGYQNPKECVGCAHKAINLDWVHTEVETGMPKGIL